MPRPTKKDARKLKARIKSLIGQGLSISEIARATGKTQQAVQQYLATHGLETVHMQKRRKNLDKFTRSG